MAGEYWADRVKQTETQTLQSGKDSEDKMNKILLHTRKYRSFKSYMKNILKTSLITSIPEITVSTSWAKRLVKLIVLILCIIGFVVQTMDFLKMYWAYPTVVNIEVYNPFQFTQPAFTVCNRNRYRRSEYCKYNPEHCDLWDVDLFCVNSPRSCPDNKTIFSASPHFHTYVVHNEQWETAIQFAHTNSIIKQCSKVIEGIKYNCSTEYQTIPFLTAEGNTNLCYTIESQWGRPNAESENHTTTFSLTLEFYLQPEEYSVVTEPVNLQLAVHDRRMLVNPYAEGYLLTGGNIYSAYISMNEQERLPSPYDTNCTDYISLWKNRNGTGPLNEMMCVEECKLNTLKKMGECIDRNVEYPHEERLCDDDEFTATGDLVEMCTKQCNPACEEKSYELEIQKINNYDSQCKSVWCRNSYALVTIYFKRFSVTKYKYQPKFESVEMFSYIGGYMGMWLGLSLISLFDLFETFLQIIYFPLGRRYWKNKKMQMKVVKNFNGNYINHRRRKHIKSFR